MTIKVKNVGEARKALSCNGVSVTSSRYTSGESGRITVSESDGSNARFILQSFGLFSY